MSKTQRVISTITLSAFGVSLSVFALRGFNISADAPQTPPDARQPASSHPVINDREQGTRVVRALREGGVHAAAVASGGRYITEYDLNPDVTFNGLDMLAWPSELVVIGRPVSAAPRISTDGKRVLTRYVVHVDETIKGTSPESVLVDILGGRFEFADRTVAEASTPGFHVSVGGKYLLFLNVDSAAPGNSDRGPFFLTNGAHGVVDLGAPDSRVHSMAKQRMPFEGENVESFIGKLRTLALTPPRTTPPGR